MIEEFDGSFLIRAFLIEMECVTKYVDLTKNNLYHSKSERSPLPVDDNLDKSITSKRSPFVLITHINSETTIPEITV